METNLLQFNHNTHSTNDLLQEIVNQNHVNGKSIPPFFALYTDFQTEGHGMGTNKWFSEEGKNLLVSFYFEPPVTADRQFLFNQYFAVTTRLFISQFADNACIKWPNDIYIGGRKVAGDLTRHTLRGNNIQYTIAGIGINLNQEWFPTDIPHPTSLYLETGQHFDVRHFLEGYHQLLCNQFDRMLYDEVALQQEYLDYLYQLNEPHRYEIQGEKLTATIRGVDRFGRLQLEDDSGMIRTCGFKEIAFVSDERETRNEKREKREKR